MLNLKCKYCSSERKNKNSLTNHERLCPKNESRVYKNGMTGKKGSNQYIKAFKEGKDKPIYPNRPKSGWAVWSVEERSKRAKEQGFGGYRENAGRSKKYKIEDSFGKLVTLQSSYELLCSEILNVLEIKWIRPKSLLYNETKRYFPDFYLPEYDVYLDPKNDYKAKLDQDKIRQVILDNNVRVEILTLDKLTEDFIKSIIAK